MTGGHSERGPNRFSETDMRYGGGRLAKRTMLPQGFKNLSSTALSREITIRITVGKDDTLPP